MSRPTSQAEYYNISQEEAKRRLDRDKSIILLDVRTPEEHAEVRIPGSQLLPLDSIRREAEKRLPNHNATIFTYCRSGKRSEAAAEALASMGYREVYNIGGIISWPYEKEKGKR